LPIWQDVERIELASVEKRETTNRNVNVVPIAEMLEVSRGSLTAPTRIKLWVTAQGKSEATRLQPVA
ncbi:hypothetical protein L5470_12070, partial [Synechococcus sp. PCC 6717]|nr:hypothetical protein [Synechococcus sp. PCC 6717]